MLALQQKFRDVASRDGNPNMINRQAFTESLTIVGVNQNDADILDRLFTMYDKTGDDIIVYKDFLAGIAPLISGSHNDKIEFSFRMLDLDGTGSDQLFVSLIPIVSRSQIDFEHQIILFQVYFEHKKC